MTNMNIADIRVNGGTQSRAAINQEVASDYADLVRAGAVFPPVTVFFDGVSYWLADGFHRYEAHVSAGAYEIAADIRQGTQRDAILFSVGANASHGLRRTNDDKRRAVLTLLNDAEWSKWSDREIARACGVSQPFVSGIRPRLTENVISEARTYTTKHGTTATMNTANIGAGSKQDQKAESAQVADLEAETAETSHDENRQAKADQENSAAPEPNAPEGNPEDAKARRDLAKLTPAALVDEVIGLREALAETKAKVKAQAQEIADLKADLAAFKQDDLGRALGNAQRQARTAEGRMREYQATAVRADRRAKILEAENTRLKAELENTMIPLN